MNYKHEFISYFLRAVGTNEIFNELLSEVNDPSTMEYLSDKIPDDVIIDGCQQRHEVNAMLFFACISFFWSHRRWLEVSMSRFNDASNINHDMQTRVEAGVGLFMIQGILFVILLSSCKMLSSIVNVFHHKYGSIQSFFKHKPDLDGVEISFRSGRLMQAFSDTYDLGMDERDDSDDNKYTCAITGDVLTSPVKIPGTGTAIHYVELACLMEWVIKKQHYQNPLTTNRFPRDFLDKLKNDPNSLVDNELQLSIFTTSFVLFSVKHRGSSNIIDNSPHGADEPLELARPLHSMS